VVFGIFSYDEFISASQVFIPEKFSSQELVVIDIFLSTSITKFRIFYIHYVAIMSVVQRLLLILPICVSEFNMCTLSTQRYCYTEISIFSQSSGIIIKTF